MSRVCSGQERGCYETQSKRAGVCFTSSLFESLARKAAYLTMDISGNSTPGWPSRDSTIPFILSQYF